MANLGYYARREGPESDFGERVCLTCVVDEWDDGFTIDTYWADCKGVSFEDAVWCGRKLDYSTLGYAIKRKKYIFVREMVDECRKELEYLGMSGERTDKPDIRPGRFVFAYYEFQEDGAVYDKFSIFYRIDSIENGMITYQAHHIGKYRLDTDSFMHTETLEDFFSYPEETTWYQITDVTFRTVPDRISRLAKRIIEKFR